MRVLHFDALDTASIEECRVIGVLHDPLLGEFVLVTDYWGIPERQIRGFLMLHFRGVREFRSVGGRVRFGGQFKGRYRIDDGVEAVIVQAATMSEDNDAKRMRLAFGTMLGQMTFSWVELEAVVRQGVAERTADGWSYRDADSGDEFDFTNPFALW